MSRFILLMFVAVALPLQALAHPSAGFWQSDVARDFSLRPDPNSSKDIRIADGPTRPKPKSAERVSVASESKSEVSAEETQEPLTSPDAIVKRFGDPNQNREMLPEGDAPPEFMGIAAAMNIGDRGLAFDYARAFVRKLEKQRDFVKRATDLQELARRAEGLLPPRETVSSPLNATEEEFLDEYLSARDGMVSDEVVDVAALGIDGGGQPPTPEKPLVDDKDIPPAPAGDVGVLVFFSNTDSEAPRFVAEIRKQHSEFSGDTKLSLAFYVKESVDIERRLALQRAFHLETPVNSGSAVAERLKLKQVPAVVFVAKKTGRVLRVYGLESAGSLGRVVNTMREKGKGQ